MREIAERALDEAKDTALVSKIDYLARCCSYVMRSML